MLLPSSSKRRRCPSRPSLPFPRSTGLPSRPRAPPPDRAFSVPSAPARRCGPWRAASQLLPPGRPRAHGAGVRPRRGPAPGPCWTPGGEGTAPPRPPNVFVLPGPCSAFLITVLPGAEILYHSAFS